MSKQNSTHREENFEEMMCFEVFVLSKIFRALGKNSHDYKKIFRTGFSRVHFYVSGGPGWAKRICSEIFFQTNKFRHWAKHFSSFDKIFHAWLSKLPFFWPSIVFRKLFLRTNFCSTFIGFRRNISKFLVKNFHKICQNRNLRVSGKISGEKKLCWLWQPDFFTSFLVFWVKLCWTFGGKNSAGLWKLHCKQPVNFFEPKRFFWEN